MKIKPYSPLTQQEFAWAAEYSDGSMLLEYDPDTKQPNNFKMIRRKDLIRFGMVGLGYKVYIENYGGFFVINGQMFEFLYRVDGKDYYLTGQPRLYSDVIHYKNGESTARMTRREISYNERYANQTTQFNFGYKTLLDISGVTFNFRVLYGIPMYGDPAYFNFWLVADSDLNGRFVIKKNGVEVSHLEFPLEVGFGTENNWVVR